MHNIREILRLHEAGENFTTIGRSVNAHRVTVREYIAKATAISVTFSRALQLSEEELRALFEKSTSGRRVKDQAIDFAHIERELHRKGVTLRLLWLEYLETNPDGYRYSQFAERFRQWRGAQKLTLRRVYKAGEWMFVDYAGHTATWVDRETGEIHEVQIFVATLAASNLIFAEATATQQTADWLGSHCRAVAYFKGVPEKVGPDNLKSGVRSPCFYEPEINRAYLEWAQHFGITVLPARVRKPQDKAKVESAVLIVERSILARLRDKTFHSLAELNVAIAALLEALNNHLMQGYGCSRWELYREIEQNALKALPAHSFEISSWKKAKVHIDYHVQFKRFFYSVPYRFVGKSVELRIREKTIDIFHAGALIATHPRQVTQGRFSTMREHLPKQHEFYQGWHPGKFLSWAEKIGVETKRQVNSILLSKEHPELTYRQCLGVLRLEKKVGAARLEAACARANAFGIVSYKSIDSMLSKHQESLPLPAEEIVATTHHHANIRGDTDFH
jgi:transposase